MHLTFITSNIHKAKQLSEWLNHPVDHVKLDLDELQTTNLKELVTHKALQAYQKLNSPVLVEDTSLIFHALNTLPGPFIKFFEKELGLENCSRILDPFTDRSATAIALYGLCLDGTHVHLFQGETKGEITHHPIGDDGFGWNPMFRPEGSDKTFAQMTMEEIKPFNHRAKATQKLAEFLSQYHQKE